ncbi:MAG: twitching motility protein PilT [Gemmatimonadales bacterium]|nr:Twitching mobility protein [bacterium HR33]GIW53537.1 MAG: twitching motility protein PilT [Gemmatimonadales bacterium]
MAEPAKSPAPFNFKAAITEMVRMNGSDLHLKVGRPPTVRVAGELVQLDQAPLKPEELKALAEQIMTPRQVKEFAEHKEADFAIGVPGVGRFRTNVYQQRGTLAFVFRAIPYEIKTIEELKLPKVLEKIALKPRGLVLVTGVTGSGKSTALAAMIHHINQHRRCNIITIEDPIEFLHRDLMSNISQREVGTDTLSFETALRHVLRQDPDVILIGEIRDKITLDTAMKAADTGHLVFSTLHTTDATQTINRVISFFPPHEHEAVRHLLSSALEAVISLRLVPTKDGKGRVPACEILINTAAVRDAMRDTEKALNIPDLIREGTVQYGMQSFDQSLMQWYQSGVISYEAALFYSTNPSEFALRVSGIEGTSDRTFADQLGGGGELGGIIQ